MPKSKSLKSLKEVNGRDETKTKKFQPTTLEGLWGEGVSNKYNTLDTEEYEKYLNEELNSAEIRRHAIEVAHIAPGTDLERTKNRLITEHKKYVQGLRKDNYPEIPKEKPVSKEVLKIMAETK